MINLSVNARKYIEAVEVIMWLAIDLISIVFDRG
jgi:hypothetical protein